MRFTLVKDMHADHTQKQYVLFFNDSKERRFETIGKVIRFIEEQNGFAFPRLHLWVRLRPQCHKSHFPILRLGTAMKDAPTDATYLGLEDEPRTAFEAHARML